MHISIVGSGYVGTTAAACFANLGHTVTTIDIDDSIVAAIEAGDAPIHEPGLDELVRELPHFPGDEHQFGFATPVRGRGGERHDFVVVFQLLHYLPEAVADVRAGLCLDLFADPLDDVLGDDVIQAEPLGSSVLEFLLNGVVLRGTERPVQEQPCGILSVELVPVLFQAPERDVSGVEVEFPDRLLRREALIEVAEELCLQVDIALNLRNKGRSGTGFGDVEVVDREVVKVAVRVVGVLGWLQKATRCLPVNVRFPRHVFRTIQQFGN